MLCTFLEHDGDSTYAVMVDTAKDIIMWITDAFPSPHEATMAALAWTDEYLERSQARNERLLRQAKEKKRRKSRKAIANRRAGR